MAPYKCGQCGYLSLEMADLHCHLLDHSESIGYFFLINCNTAFPKWQYFDSHTQTEDRISVEAQLNHGHPEIKAEISACVDTKWLGINDHQKEGDVASPDDIPGVGWEVFEEDAFQETDCSELMGSSDHSIQNKYFPQNLPSVNFNNVQIKHEVDIEEKFMHEKEKKKTKQVKQTKKRKSRKTVEKLDIKSQSDVSVDFGDANETKEQLSSEFQTATDNINEATENSEKELVELKHLYKLYKVDKSESKTLMHMCTVCAYRCTSKYQIMVHISKHCEKNFLICEVCGAAVANKQALSNHKKNHCSKKHECNVCYAVFSRPSRLLEHIRLHSGECPFVCDQCGKNFRTQTYLNKHQRCVHSSVKNYKCDKCEKSFKIPWLLTRHVRTHNKVIPYCCQFCEKRFSTRWNMKAHMRRHTGDKPYPCSNCGECFAHNVVRKTHQAKCFVIPVKNM